MLYVSLKQFSVWSFTHFFGQHLKEKKREKANRKDQKKNWSHLGIFQDSIRFPDCRITRLNVSYCTTNQCRVKSYRLGSSFARRRGKKTKPVEIKGKKSWWKNTIVSQAPGIVQRINGCSTCRGLLSSNTAAKWKTVPKRATKIKYSENLSAGKVLESDSLFTEEMQDLWGSKEKGGEPKALQPGNHTAGGEEVLFQSLPS